MTIKSTEIKQGVARIDTNTIINTSNDLTEIQKKALLYFISKIDHNQKFQQNQVISVIIPFSDLVKGLGTYGIKWKESKIKFNEFVDDIASAKINFFTEVVINGETLKGFFNWFSGIKPIEQNGTPHYEVRFNSDVTDFIFNLKKFTRLYSNDFEKLKGKSTVDLFSVLAAIYGKQTKYKDKVTVEYSIDELKLKLNINKKDYSDNNNFKRRVIDYSISQINNNTSIYVWYEKLKKGRKVSGFKFFIVNNYSHLKEVAEPSRNDIGSLKIYEYEAYKILKIYGVIPGIIIKQILPNLSKGILSGYEDLFIKKCIQHFESKTNKKTLKEKVGAFVQWFCSNKVYTDDTNPTYVKLKDDVIAEIKMFSNQIADERRKMKNISMLEKYGEQKILEF